MLINFCHTKNNKNVTKNSIKIKKKESTNRVLAYSNLVLINATVFTPSPCRGQALNAPYSTCLLIIAPIDSIIRSPWGAQYDAEHDRKQLNEWVNSAHTCSLHTKLSKSVKCAHMEERLFTQRRPCRPTLGLIKWKIPNPTD